MRIVKEGQDPKNRIWRGVCTDCKAEIEARQNELTNIQPETYRGGPFSWEKCISCGAGGLCKGVCFYPVKTVEVKTESAPGFKQAGIKLDDRLFTTEPVKPLKLSMEEIEKAVAMAEEDLPPQFRGEKATPEEKADFRAHRLDRANAAAILLQLAKENGVTMTFEEPGRPHHLTVRVWYNGPANLKLEGMLRRLKTSKRVTLYEYRTMGNWTCARLSICTADRMVSMSEYWVLTSNFVGPGERDEKVEERLRKAAQTVVPMKVPWI